MQSKISEVVGIVGIFYLWNIFLVHVAQGCGIRWPQWTSSENEYTISKQPEADFDSSFSSISNETEMSMILMKSENNMMSVALKFIVNYIIESGSLEFSCPKVNGIYPDSLDCHKYYICENYNFTEKTCLSDMGFDNVTNSCVPKTKVPRCTYIQIQQGFICNSTGLHVYDGDCSKFILCTKNKKAFAAGCNKGDFFDQNLLICLPSTEVVC